MLLVVCIATVNILLAYFFRETGEIQFMGLLVATCLLALFHGARLSRATWQRIGWIPGRVLALGGVGAFVFMCCMSAMFTLGFAAQDGKFVVPWYGVLLSAAVFFLPQIRQKRTPTVSTSAVQLVAVFYTILILLLACVSYLGSGITRFGALLLVLAVQLQFVMNYAATETSYLLLLEHRSRKVAGWFRVHDAVSVGNIALLLGAMPFFTPLCIILLAASISH